MQYAQRYVEMPSLLFRKLAFTFGSSISCESLRQAMLAHNAFCLERDTATQSHTARSRQALISKRHSAFHEGDLLATYLLAILNARRRNPQELFIHLQGFLYTLQHLRQERPSAKSSIFVRMAVQDLIWHAGALDDAAFLKFWRDIRAIMGPPTRHQCETYITEFANGDKSRVRLWSLTEFLWPTFCFLKRCLRYTVYKQSKNLFDLDGPVTKMIEEVKGLMEELKVPRTASQYEDEMGCVGVDRYQKWLAWFPCFIYHVSCFSVSLLQAPSILIGIEAAAEREELGRLIGFLADDFERFCPSDWYQPGLSIFWLAGLVSPSTKFPESIFRKLSSTLTLQFRDGFKRSWNDHRVQPWL